MLKYGAHWNAGNTAQCNNLFMFYNMYVVILHVHFPKNVIGESPNTCEQQYQIKITFVIKERANSIGKCFLQLISEYHIFLCVLQNIKLQIQGILILCMAFCERESLVSYSEVRTYR